MLRTILVPLDGSTFSAGALSAAAALAVRHHATLHLVSVYTPLSVPLPFTKGPIYDTAFDDQQRAALRAALERYAQRLREECSIGTTTAVLDGAPADRLAAEAEARGAELIVMTTHGRGGFARSWLGSVADETVRRAAAPVLMIRPAVAEGEDDGPAAVVAPVIDPGTVVIEPAAALRLRRVVVPLDGSRLAEEILDPAMRLGVPGETTYVLLRVVLPATVPTVPLPGVTPSDAADYLEGVAERVRATGFPVDTVVEAADDPARGVLRAAVDRRADLVAISTHARSGIARLLLGSVADKVVRGAPCPTLVARPRG